MSDKPKSIVVLSGGQDSVTTLYQALRDTQVIGAVHFRYGQKHAVEIDCAGWHARQTKTPFHVLDVPSFEQIGNSALLLDAYGDETGDVGAAHPTLSHLPASFVPGRNLVFLTLAAALAMKKGAAQIWTGVCQTDFSGYPDCREQTMLRLQDTLQIGMDFHELEIVTPLMHLTKAQTFDLAQSLGVLDDVLERTHTCYNGDHSTRHDWGYGCAKCPACQVRENGWKQFTATR